jgi:hypothetical protein
MRGLGDTSWEGQMDRQGENKNESHITVNNVCAVLF